MLALEVQLPNSDVSQPQLTLSEADSPGSLGGGTGRTEELELAGAQWRSCCTVLAGLSLCPLLGNSCSLVL